MWFKLLELQRISMYDGFNRRSHNNGHLFSLPWRRRCWALFFNYYYHFVNKNINSIHETVTLHSIPLTAHWHIVLSNLSDGWTTLVLFLKRMNKQRKQQQKPFNLISVTSKILRAFGRYGSLKLKREKENNGIRIVSLNS